MMSLSKYESGESEVRKVAVEFAKWVEDQGGYVVMTSHMRKIFFRRVLGLERLPKLHLWRQALSEMCEVGFTTVRHGTTHRCDTYVLKTAGQPTETVREAFIRTNAAFYNERSRA